jgi:hypothetical protein
LIGLIVTVLAMRTTAYRLLSNQYAKQDPELSSAISA